MQGFVARENIRRYEALLDKVASQEERSRISALLAEEREKLAALEAQDSAGSAGGAETGRT